MKVWLGSCVCVAVLYGPLYFCVYRGIFIGKTFEDLTRHAHTQKAESVSEETNKQKLHFKFYRRFQFAQSKLGFSLGH